MKIVITELIWPCGIERLEMRNWRVVYDPELWRQPLRLAEELQDADAVIVRNQTRVDRALLEGCRRLKVIGRLGVGLDNIDLQAADERQAAVVFARNANATSVAEYVISCLFAVSRLIKEGSEDVKRGGWNRKAFTGTEVYGKTLGLIGIGEIGQRVAVRAKALGLAVIGCDPFVASFDYPVMEAGVTPVGLEELLARADFVSLHVPLTPQTRGMIGQDALSRMKPSAYLINTSRGGIIDENQLAAALTQKSLAGAFLDVLEKEPPDPGHPLFAVPSCVITPHIAGLTEEAQVRTSDMVAQEVIRELEGTPSLCRVKVRR